MKNKNINDKILSLFTMKIKQKFGNEIKRFILFGSRARGDNNPYSDYDILIICKNIPTEMKKYIDDLESEVLLSKFALISTFMILEKDFKRRIYDPYLMNAKKEGISI